MKKLQGEIFQLAITLRDLNGNDVNPDATIFNKIEIYIVNRMNKVAYAQYSTVAQTGFTNTRTSNGKLIINIPSDATLNSPVGFYEVEVWMYIRNADVPGRQLLVKKKGVIFELGESVKAN